MLITGAFALCAPVAAATTSSSNFDDEVPHKSSSWPNTCSCTCLDASPNANYPMEVSISMSNCTTCYDYCQAHLGCYNSTSGGTSGSGYSVECGPDAGPWWAQLIVLIVVVGPVVCWLCGLVYYCHDAKKHPGREPRACFKCFYPLCAIYMYDGCCAASTWISAIFCCIFWPVTWFYANCCWIPRDAYYVRHHQKPPDVYVAYSTAPHQYDGQGGGYPAPYHGGSGGSGGGGNYTGNALDSFGPPLQQSPRHHHQQQQQVYVPPQVVLAVPQNVHNPVHAQPAKAQAVPLQAYVAE